MKGGFGKFLTFILGLVVGVLLVGGTIAGVVYYAVAAVSVNDVENYTKQEFTFIDKDAEIRNKSILDIYDMVKGGNIKETTVSDAKRIFGIDIIKILENSLEITVGMNRAMSNCTPLTKRQNIYWFRLFSYKMTFCFHYEKV